MHYPCSTYQDLPQFDNIDLEQQLAQVLTAIDTAKQQIDQLVDDHCTGQTLLRQLEQLQNAIDKPFSPISHLSGVANTDQVRDLYQQAINALTEYGTQIGQHAGLYAAYKQLALDTLDSADQEAVKQSILGFELSGIGLESE